MLTQPFSRSVWIILFICLARNGTAQIAAVGESLPPWQPGYLDLHHINTGRGDAAYYIFPDGTTMLLDAGEQDPTDPRTLSARNSPIRPNDTKRPFEWIVQYIGQVAPADRKTKIDYALVTHFHDDHMGAWYAGAPASTRGRYALTGITGVAEKLPIGLLLDRGYPDYNYPYDLKSKAYEMRAKSTAAGSRYWQTMQNYLAFIDAGKQSGMRVANLAAGSRTQIRMMNQPGKYPDFYIQNIKSNGKIWTGKDSTIQEQFPPRDTADAQGVPTENALSQVLVIHYGPFKYYTGGDGPGNLNYGDKPWMDVETPVARAVGAVDVATLDHHGNRDAMNEFMVKTLRPRVWIGQSWSSDHPGHEVLIRLTTPYLYPGKRDLFATYMSPANRDVIGNLIDASYRSQQGHILVRVLPGGKQYHVIILDDTKEVLRVKSVFGPYNVTPK